MNRRHLRLVGTLLLVLTLVPFVVFAVPQVVGASHSYVVSSSSMSPEIHAGDVVIVRSVRPAEIDAGDVITFEDRGAGDGQRSSSDRVTHRVVEVIERDDGHYFRTRGDANDAPDSELVPAENVIGAVTFTIPRLGWVVNFANSDTGILAFIVGPMTALVVSELWTLYRAAQTTSDTPSEDSPEATDD